MSKKLAIKGHPTRGKEVIELFEMMGGVNCKNFTGKCDFFYFFIDNNIICSDSNFNNNFAYFTIEEFLEKFPYKVGDKVIDDSGESGIIIKMKWDEEIIYKVDFGKECYYFTSDFLRPYKETNMNDNKFAAEAITILASKTNSVEPIEHECERTHEDVIFDSIIWHLRNSINNGKQNLSGGECEDYFRKVVKKNNENKMKNVLAELFEHIKNTSKEKLEKEFNELEEWSHVAPTVEEFMDFCDKVNKKPKYPRTYEECCKNYPDNEKLNIGNLLCDLEQLIICRNAYWKIAGEELGLDKSWEPDFTDDEERYGIYTTANKVVKDFCGVGDVNMILTFPTEEMRDAFYENFKDLIEQCKELL